MARGYTPIEAKVLEQFLQKKGFRRAVVGSEVVYVREHGYSPAVKIKVWTSLRVGAEQARGAGQDAIRVTAAYEWSKPIKPRYNAEPSDNFGIFKSQRVFRTGGEEAILERLYERMREAYGFSNEWIRNHWRDLGSVGATRRPDAHAAAQVPAVPQEPSRQGRR